MRRSLLLPICAALLLGGCARLSVNTDLAADGSFKRVVTYSATDSQMDMFNQHGKHDITEVFSIPVQAPGIIVERKKTDDGGVSVTVTRSISAGAPPLEDIVALGPQKKATLKSSVLVRRLENGNLEYQESLRSFGPQKNTFVDLPADLRSQVKQSLPPRLVKTETVDAICHRIMRALSQVFFGPAEPMMPLLVSDPDLAERKVRIAFYQTLAPALEQEYGMTRAETRAMVAELTKEDRMKSVLQSKMPSAPGAPSSEKSSDSNQSEFMPLTFAVHFPGKIVRTNGLIDPVTGEVYWSLYDVAVEFEDVTLDLVVEPKS